MIIIIPIIKYNSTYYNTFTTRREYLKEILYYNIAIIAIQHSNSTLRYECDETFSDECEFAARAEGE